MNGVLVSVYCLAYNHEKYIRSALEGFVTQKTNFSYEVFVHDDASQDSTASIIMEYAEKYPQIIKPIIQKENLYSKGKSALFQYILPRMQGKYIAVCEGDDYWCDPTKLQRQCDFLESHTEYVASTHNTWIHDENTGKERLLRRKRCRSISLGEIMRWKEGFHTSSIMYRREMIETFPGRLKSPNGAGDYSLALWLRLNGKINYINRAMSKYRFQTENSWSMRHTNPEENNSSKILVLEAFNCESNFKYNRKIKKEIGRLQAQNLYINNCINELAKMGYSEIIKLGYVDMAVSVFLQRHNYKLYSWISKTFYNRHK